jgi:pimeloyl-ACP methyl ester carboxylesterase
MRTIPARCGHLSVPENWENKKGRHFKLFLAVLPAKQKSKRKADPLFFFSGGPGQAATETYPDMARAFSSINQERDIVLIDQRGTGQSNPIRCDDHDPKALIKEPTPDDMAKALKKCVASQKNKSLQYYTTTASIQDFNAVRKALGYDKINLYGISYGTRVAQSYMRRYKDHVRSVIIDGVIPQELMLGYDTSVHAPDRVKKWLLLRCKADTSCHKAFPKLGESLAAVEKMIRDTQPIVTIVHPRTHKTIRVKLTWSIWALSFRLFGYSSGMVSVLPLLIHNSHKTKDVRPLVKWVLAQMEDLGRIISKLENSVLCAEDWPFLKKSGKIKQKSPTGYGDIRLQSIGKLCSVWPHGTVKAAFKQPIKSDIPTLLLSGQYDPVTPPAFASRVAKHLTNQLHIIVPGEGHGAIGHGCVPRLAKAFVKDASVAKLDATCIKTHRIPRFFIDFAGPELAK